MELSGGRAKVQLVTLQARLGQTGTLHPVPTAWMCVWSGRLVTQMFFITQRGFVTLKLYRLMYLAV